MDNNYKLITDEQLELLMLWAQDKEFYGSLSWHQAEIITRTINNGKINHSRAYNLNSIRDKWINYLKNEKVI